MKGVRMITLVCFSAPATFPFAQSQAPSKQAFTVTLLPATQKVTVGTHVKVKAVVQSTTDIHEIADREVTVGCSLELVHVETEVGEEAERTAHYRHLFGDFRPGEAPDNWGGSCVGQDLRAGGTVVRIFDLSYYYVLTAPGKYSVSVQIDDEVRNPEDKSVKSYPVRSNIAHFELSTGK